MFRLMDYRISTVSYVSSASSAVVAIPDRSVPRSPNILATTASRMTGSGILPIPSMMPFKTPGGLLFASLRVPVVGFANLPSETAVASLRTGSTTVLRISERKSTAFAASLNSLNDASSEILFLGNLLSRIEYLLLL